MSLSGGVDVGTWEMKGQKKWVGVLGMKLKLGLKDQLLAIELLDSKARYRPYHLLAMTLLSPTGIWHRGRVQWAPGREAEPAPGPCPLSSAPEQIIRISPCCHLAHTRP